MNQIMIKPVARRRCLTLLVLPLAGLLAGCQRYGLKLVDAESGKPLAEETVFESWQGGTIKPFGSSGSRMIGPSGSDGTVWATDIHVARDMEYAFDFESPDYASAQLWGSSAERRWRLRYFNANQALGYADIEMQPNGVTTIPMRRLDSGDDASASPPAGAAAKAERASVGSSLEIAILDVRRSDTRLSIRWQIRNSGSTPVWVPQSWSLDSRRPMPFPFVVPPKDLMFVFGDFQTNPERGWIMEGMPGVTATKVPPNGYIGGRIDLDVPYTISKDDLPTPFANKIDPPTGTTLQAVTLHELGAIQLAVLRGRRDPAGLRVLRPSEKRLLAQTGNQRRRECDGFF